MHQVYFIVCRQKSKSNWQKLCRPLFITIVKRDEFLCSKQLHVWFYQSVWWWTVVFCGVRFRNSLNNYNKLFNYRLYDIIYFQTWIDVIWLDLTCLTDWLTWLIILEESLLLFIISTLLLFSKLFQPYTLSKWNVSKQIVT